MTTRIRRRSNHSLLRAFYLGLFLAAYVLVVYFLITTRAHAHEALSGWRYPMACCWSPSTAPAGRAGDCDAIPTQRVKEGPNGYEVTLYPGDHPMVKETISFVVPYAEAKLSPDGLYHACFSPVMKVRCFFAGSRGS